MTRRSVYLTKVYKQMLDDLTYPQAKDGSVMDASGVKAWICWHLVRTGWRKPNNTDGLALVEEYDDPVIKPRKVYGPGVMEDAITWIPADAPDDPLDKLEQMTVAQIEHLPEDIKLEAKRRLGILPPPDIAAPQPAWSVAPHVTITDEPDDQTAWT
jgi:hypothetical protein